MCNSKESNKLDSLQSIMLAIIANAEDVEKARVICDTLTSYVFDIKFDIKEKERFLDNHSLEEVANQYCRASSSPIRKYFREGDVKTAINKAFKDGAEWAFNNIDKGGQL